MTRKKKVDEISSPGSAPAKRTYSKRLSSPRKVVSLRCKAEVAAEVKALAIAARDRLESQPTTAN